MSNYCSKSPALLLPLSVLAGSGVSGRNSLRKFAMATRPTGLYLKSTGGYCTSRRPGGLYLSQGSKLCERNVFGERHSSLQRAVSWSRIGVTGGTGSLLRDGPTGIGVKFAHCGCRFCCVFFSQILLEQHAILFIMTMAMDLTFMKSRDATGSLPFPFTQLGCAVMGTRRIL
jgi:hypothetical protein